MEENKRVTRFMTRARLEKQIEEGLKLHELTLAMRKSLLKNRFDLLDTVTAAEERVVEEQKRNG